MNFKEKFVTILTKPDKFFDKIKSENKIKDAFSFLLTVSLVYLVATVFLIVTGPLASLGLAGIASVSLFTWAMSILLMFVMAAIVSTTAKLLGGKGDYAKAFNALVYGSLPSQILGWLPFVGFLFAVWSVYLQTKGVSKLYKMGMFRSLVAVISPTIIALVLIVIFASSLINGSLQPMSG
ncbi:MAG: YIP1 family protein [Candidatus Aenigmarchaeota archaeon]|nr:YIP1 family protein [Candidatus Aenigmarchaeota archaeon]